MTKKLVFALLLTGCASQQRPYVFNSPAMARDPIEALRDAVSASGLVPAHVDPRTGLVQTRWEDTSLHDGTVGDKPATILRRYSATLAHTLNGYEVTVEASTQRCAIGSFSLSEQDVQGNCQKMDRLLPKHYEELLQLGGRLQQQMSVP